MIAKTVLIIGGGPAGAACGQCLQTAGIDTLVLDKQQFPRPKLCAGWITPRVFDLLGISPRHYPHGLVTFKRLICFVKGRRLAITTRQYSVRRYEFDAWLLQRAGVPVVQHTVQTIRRDGSDYVVDDRYRAKYLVGAGGTHCPVYRHFFRTIRPHAERARIITVEEEFPCEDHDSHCYLWFFENGLPGYAWYVPKANGYVNIGVGGKEQGLKKRGQTINRHWQWFQQKLIHSGLVPDRRFVPRGHVYYIRRSPALQKDRLYLTGDAAGLATADMGEGIRPAIESGFRAASAIVNQTPYKMPLGAKYSWPGILGHGLLTCASGLRNIRL